MKLAVILSTLFWIKSLIGAGILAAMDNPQPNLLPIFKGCLVGIVLGFFLMIATASAYKQPAGEKVKIPTIPE